MGFKARIGEYKSEIGPSIKEIKFILKRIRKNPLSLVGAIMLLFFTTIALLAPLLAPPTPGNPYIMPYEGPQTDYDYMIAPLPSPPSAKHPFGTLQGYDVYYGCIWGTRSAFRVSALVILGTLVIGLIVGCIAGYSRGFISELTMRITDIFFAFPDVLLAVVLIAALSSPIWISLGPLEFAREFSSMNILIIALFMVRWPTYARLFRGEIMRVKNQDFIEAAKAIGCSGPRVMIKHILPNTIYPIFIMAFLDIGGIVLSFSTLSFLGFGPEMGYADWAVIISHSRGYIIGTKQDLFKHGYIFFMPSIFISGFILAWSLLGDALRDIVDPMTRRR